MMSQITNQKSSLIAGLMNRFMDEVGRVVEEEDWQEFDGWAGRMVIWDTKWKQIHVYEIRDGKLLATECQGPFVATVTMSVDTFLDLIDAALPGIESEVALVYERKYAAGHIFYEGERWLVDSERFRQVFRRLGNAGSVKEGVTR